MRRLGEDSLAASAIKAIVVVLSVITAAFVVAIVLFAGARGTGNVSLFNGTALATAAVSIGFTGMVALGGTFFAIRLSRRARETVHEAGDCDEQQLGERRDDNEPELERQAT